MKRSRYEAQSLSDWAKPKLALRFTILCAYEP
jgi:hypothetical protein